MKNAVFIITILLNYTYLFSQNKSKNVFPIGIYHSKATKITGLSLGIGENHWFKKTELTTTKGIRIELNPLAPFYFIVPRSPISHNEKRFQEKMKTPPNQKIYGLNISTGSFENLDSFGISLTGFMHYSRKNYGISIAGISNSIEKLNGISIAIGLNEAIEMKGIQIGGFWGNGTEDLIGMQIGVENYIQNKGIGLQVGLFNYAKNLKGLQLGLWNKNQKRSLPFINWNFKN